jgi:3-(3-hydroxy-phenyl)propionate hydroxylase
MAEANHYPVSDICQSDAGFMVQNAALVFNRRQSGSLADLIQWANGRMLLLVFGSLGRKELAKLQSLSIAANVYVVQVTHRKPGQVTEHVMDTDKSLRQACRAEKSQWALIRPDAYLAAKGKAINGQLVKALAQAMAMH